MRTTLRLAPMILLAAASSGCGHAESETPALARRDQQVRDALEKTSAGIRAAYARGDVAAVMSFHHPEVTKAPAFDRYLVGSAAVEKSVADGLMAFRIEFVEHEVESVLALDGSAMQMTRYTIRRTPRGGGESTLFRARALSIFVRYAGSPTGWAVIREVAQPAPE